MIMQWPGYTPWSRKVRLLYFSPPSALNFSCHQIRLSNWKKSPERIRLEKLATEVAKCVERFTRVSRLRFSQGRPPLIRFVGRRPKLQETLIGNSQIGESALNLLKSINWCLLHWTKFPKGLGSLVSASSPNIRLTPAPPRLRAEASFVLCYTAVMFLRV